MNMDIRLLLIEGREIKAIRRCRLSTGMGLKEAVDYVERIKCNIY